MNMKLFYVANIRFPTEKAHGAQIMKMCEAFASLGHDVELVVSDRKTDIREDPFAYYGIRKTFPITRLHVPDTVRLGRIGYLFESLVFARAALHHLQTKTFDCLYGRDERILYFLRKRGLVPVVWETHTGAENALVLRLAQKAERIVAITKGLKNLYVALGVPPEKIIVAPDGVDDGNFAHPESKESARKRLGLPRDKKIAMYIGRLDGWKGSETFLEASNILPDDIMAVVIGGEPRQVSELSRQYPKVRFLGYMPYKELPDNQAAADVLVLPNTARDEISAHFTSPLKLFAYMASSVPIVASDLPSIREVLDESTALFFRPDNPKALAGAISETLEAREEALKRAKCARKAITSYTWNIRARNILTHITKSV